MNKVKILIYNTGNWNYMMWFLLGFYQNENIELVFKSGMCSKIAQHISNDFISNVIRKLNEKKNTDMVLQGVAIIDGKEVKFAIDPYDSPFMYRKELLEKVDIYFKMQCPKEFKKEGFWLSSVVCVPWIDFECNPDGTRKIISNIEDYKNKIKPLMIGTRKLAAGISKKSLQKGYQYYIKDYNEQPRKKLMCYFGNAEGPGVVEKEESLIDLDSEKQIMFLYRNQLNHPNEKRYKAAREISELEPCELYDARVINQGNNDKCNVGNESIPIEEFCAHISKFDYNLNISGFRLSIPNRFIESFMVGTGIVTDKLHVKWYQPFDDEVFETVDMGYELNEKIDWEGFRNDICNLPTQSSKKIKELFDRKWSPVNVSQYIIDTLISVKK